MLIGPVWPARRDMERRAIGPNRQMLHRFCSFCLAGGREILDLRALSGPPSSPRTRPDRRRCESSAMAPGEVAEWLNAPHSKCGIGASLSGVRIPPSPPKPYPPPFADIHKMLRKARSAGLIQLYTFVVLRHNPNCDCGQNC